MSLISLFFWSNDCGNRNTPPSSTNICVGKHTGRNDRPDFTETLGYFIAEQGNYYLPTVDLKIYRGSDTVRGTTNSPPYPYELDLEFTYAMATQAAEDGGNGGWAVLYGANPISTVLNLAVDEDQFSNNNRGHTTEQIDYWVMEPVTRDYAQMNINEILYDPASGELEFIEFYVSDPGTTRGFIHSSQDGTTQTQFFPTLDVSVGDYIILEFGLGANSQTGNVYTIYTGVNQSQLANAGDDVVLLAPSTTDSTVIDGVTYDAVPSDYVSYGTGGSIDPIPISNGGVTVFWDGSNITNLDGAASGQSISLTPNATDGDLSVCWELTTSGDAALLCLGYLPTQDTDPSASINSRGLSNTNFPILSLQKVVETIFDPVNLTTNPKSIPGSVEKYTLTAENSGNAAADPNSVSLTDILPSDAKLCVANSAQCQTPVFTDGSPSSGLSQNQILYSNDGGATFLYLPVADADGADTAVTHLRLTTLGAFQAQSAATAPSFTFEFYIVLE